MTHFRDQIVRLIERAYRTFKSAWYDSEIAYLDSQIQKQRLIIHRAKFRNKGWYHERGKNRLPTRKDS